MAGILGRVALPELTPEQRADALAKAAEARRVRAQVKHSLKYSQGRISDVIALGKRDDIIGKMKVVELLESVPGVGKVKAVKVMEEIGIATSRRVRGLGEHQASALISRFDPQ